MKCCLLELRYRGRWAVLRGGFDLASFGGGGSILNWKRGNLASFGNTMRWWCEDGWRKSAEMWDIVRRDI